MDVAINYFAVLVSALAAMGLGFLWYGPVFGAVWMKEMGFTKEGIGDRMKAQNINLTYVLQAAGALVMAYVLAHFIVFLDIADIPRALTFGFWVWLGFVATTSMGQVLWEGKSWSFYAITVGYYLISLEIMAGILAVWH